MDRSAPIITAMDHRLIAPCPDSKHRDGIWRVGPGLDAHIEHQRELVALVNQPVILPTEEAFCPAIQSFLWREGTSTLITEPSAIPN